MSTGCDGGFCHVASVVVVVGFVAATEAPFWRKDKRSACRSNRL
jgi:hypothetical protein